MCPQGEGKRRERRRKKRGEKLYSSIKIIKNTSTYTHTHACIMPYSYTWIWAPKCANTHLLKKGKYANIDNLHFKAPLDVFEIRTYFTVNESTV